MTTVTNQLQRVNGAATAYNGAAHDSETEDFENEAMPQETLKLPTWAIGTLITLAIAFLGQFGTTLYQAGQWQSNQTHMSAQIQEMRTEISRQREQIEALRLELAGTRK